MKAAPTLVGIPPKDAIVSPIKRALVTRKGRIDNPIRALIYGMEKVGKTSFAAQIERVVFLCKENGNEQFDVERLSEPTHWRNAPLNEEGRRLDVFSLLEELRTADHDFQALALDTVDWIEPLLHRYVCISGPKKVDNMVLAYGGYGKGYDVANNEWHALLSVLERIRTERRMHIILLGHAHVKNFNNPEGENYDRYELKMHYKAAALLKEWCDMVLFAHQEVFASQKETVSEVSKNKMFGVSSGTRYLYTERRPAWDAGNRYGLPEKMPISWNDVYAYAKQKKGPGADEFIAAIHEKMSFLTEENQQKVYGLLDRAQTDIDKLRQILHWVEAIQQQ